MTYLTIISKFFVSSIICLFIFINKAACQQITIRGEILDESGTGITDCNIKIIAKKSRLVLNYTNTENKNTFEARVNLTSADTLVITISHIGYSDTTFSFVAISEKEMIFLNVLLRVKIHNLNGVIVNATPVWRHGDTTFYRAESFAEGSENKLKDLLEKIPGFEVTEDGQLLYQRKQVDKIMVDGEELFSDKIALMLNNFPVHLLKTIQAIQNQSDNTLLHGLTTNGNVILNLGLNNDKLKAVFGDGEAGMGTVGKYSVSPVLFSILGKVKAGFIGNWNNIGNGIGWRQMYEIKNDHERMAENWLIRSLSPQSITSFENRWYINNNQWDNRLQMNTPLAKNLKSKTEVNFLKDRQKQESFTTSSYFNGNDFYLRNDSNHINFMPGLFKIREKLAWSIDSLKALEATVEYLKNYSTGRQNIIYNQNGTNTFLSNSLSNNWNSFSLRAVYTSRISASKANESYIEINRQTQAQTGVGISPNWPAIYVIPNNQYNTQYQLPGNHINILKAGIRQLKNVKKGFGEMGLYYNMINAKLKNVEYLSDAGEQLPKVRPAEFNNEGNYTVNKIRSEASNKMRFSKNFSLLLNTELGLSEVGLNEKNKTTSFITPETNINIKYISVDRKILPSFSAAFIQEQSMPYVLYQFARPVSASDYVQHSNIKLPLRHYELTVNKRWNYPNNFSTGDITLSYFRYLTSPASINAANNFVQILKDSLVNKLTTYFSIITFHEIPSLLINALIRIRAGYTASSNLFVSQGQIFNTKNLGSFFNLSIRKNWNRKYFIDLKSDINFNHYKLPKQVSENISPKVLNLKNSLSQRIWLNKQVNILATTSFFSNNIFTTKKASFTFFDIECNIKIKKSPVLFTLRGENLTNEKYFYSNNSEDTFQSFYKIPLIQRRIFISIKYDL